MRLPEEPHSPSFGRIYNLLRGGESFEATCAVAHRRETNHSRYRVKNPVLYFSPVPEMSRAGNQGPSSIKFTRQRT